MNIQIKQLLKNKQICTIDGLDYQFEFSERDLIDSIETNCSWSDLENRSGCDLDDFSDFEMASIIAEDWEHSDVEMMIKNYIKENPNNLQDHLISNL